MNRRVPVDAETRLKAVTDARGSVIPSSTKISIGGFDEAAFSSSAASKIEFLDDCPKEAPAPVRGRIAPILTVERRPRSFATNNAAPTSTTAAKRPTVIIDRLD